MSLTVRTYFIVRKKLPTLHISSRPVMWTGQWTSIYIGSDCSAHRNQCRIITANPIRILRAELTLKHQQTTFDIQCSIKRTMQWTERILLSGKCKGVCAVQQRTVQSGYIGVRYEWKENEHSRYIWYSIFLPVGEKPLLKKPSLPLIGPLAIFCKIWQV